MSNVQRIIAVIVAAGITVPALAQADVAAEAQRKLLSQRAAQADAYRKLAETVKGLQITSDTYVRDFVAESDVIQSELDTFIRGVRLGKAKCYEDLTCEVPAEVTVAKVVTTLKEIHTRHYKGGSIKGTDIEQMNKKIVKKVIKVVGMGAPREDLPPDLPEGVEAMLKGPPPSPEPPIPPLWLKIGPQARLLAIRAARLDALRKLTERIRGIRITSDTLVRDFVVESDVIQTVTQGTLMGFTEKRTYLHHDEPIAEVTIEIPLESVITTIKKLHSRSIQGDRVKGSDITELTQRIKRKTFEATGMGVAPPRYLARVEAVTQITYPGWAKNVIKMEGSGVPKADKAGTAQGKLMAARAAELDAKRKLAEHIYGLQIDSDTLVRDFVTEHDEIRSHMDAVLVGSMIESTRFDNEIAIVVVSIPGMQVWEIVSARIRVIRMGG